MRLLSSNQTYEVYDRVIYTINIAHSYIGSLRTQILRSKLN